MGCVYDGTVPPGSRHRIAVTELHGVMGEICDPNWAATLDRIGDAAFGAVRHYTLTGLPNGPVEVRVNGQVVTAATFDAATNAIDFPALYAPSPGDHITATYDVACH